MKTYQELLAEAKARIAEVSVWDALGEHPAGTTVFLDVRDPHEYNLGRIAGAVTISRGNLEKGVEGMIPRDRRVIVYCANGNRSAFAAETLALMGYQDVRSLREGFSGWVAEGGDVE